MKTARVCRVFDYVIFLMVYYMDKSAHNLTKPSREPSGAHIREKHIYSF